MKNDKLEKIKNKRKEIKNNYSQNYYRHINTQLYLICKT